jgi:HSP20 family protein
MSMKDFMPSIWKKGASSGSREEERSFYPLQREMNRLFDDFFSGFEPTPFRGFEDRWGGFSPSVDVKETEKEIVVKAELPGIEEKDMEVSVTDDALTIRGEKKEEKEEKGKGYYHIERSYGSFHREISLPAGVDADNVHAGFKNGVLTVKIPKKESAADKRKKVTIKSE